MKFVSFDQSIWQKGLHVLTLFAIAVAHPLFDLTAQNPAFFVGRKSEPVDLLFLVFALCFLIPALLVLIESLLGHRKIAGRIFHGIIFFILCSAIVMPALKKATDAGSQWIIPTTTLLCAGLTFVYFRLASVRSSINFLSPVILIVPLLFLIHPRINRIVWPSQDQFRNISIQAKYPVVMIVFDEFPLKSLLGENGDIDAERFPNFYELSRKATWYRNATTVAGDTIQAIPAILTGNFPTASLLPNRTDYPQNLLSLMESQYELRIHEFITGFSPKESSRKSEPLAKKMPLLFADLTAVYLHHLLPEDQAKRLPVITQTWGHFWERRAPQRGTTPQTSLDQRALKFRRFVTSISKSRKPRFYFLHTMLPHVPWQYFPTGTQYNSNGIGYFGVDGLTKHETWIKNPAAKELSFKRHLLQVAFVDRLLGELLQRLKQRQLFERTLLVIVADHGTSFQGEARRTITKENFEDILRIPLFIKAPFQKQGGISDIDAQIIDIVPTIRKILSIDSAWKSDGRSLINDSEKPKLRTFLFQGKTLQFPPMGPAPKGFEQTDPEKISIAAHPEWLGKSLLHLQDGGSSPIEVHLHNSDAFRNVDPESGFIPALVTAHMERQDIPETVTFGIVVNGVLRATTQTFEFGEKTKFLSSVVPESSFQPGSNQIEIILFSGEGSKVFLRPRLIQDKGQPVLDYSGRSSSS